MKGKEKHIAVWALLIVYLLFANSVYVQFFVKHGKPVQASFTLPPETTNPGQEIYTRFDSVKPINYDGENLYQLVGYAFTKASSDTDTYRLTIILHSTTQNLVFKADPLRRTDVTRGLPQYQKNLDNSGFRLLLSRNAIKIDNYQIQLLMESTTSSTRYFIKTGSYLERTPNTLRLITDR